MEKIIRKLNETDLKIYYKKVFWVVIVIHLLTCLFISGNIFFILLAMIGSFIIMKICEISVSFVYTIPFITEDDRRRIAEKDPYSYKLVLYKKSVKHKYIQAFMFSSLLILFSFINLGIVYDYFFKHLVDFEKMLSNAIFLGFGLGGLRAICYKMIE